MSSSFLFPFLAVLPAAGYSLFTLACARSFFREEAHPSLHNPPVSVLKPVKGEDAESYENFASFCRQDYPGELQIVFAAASADDPAVAVARRIAADFPAVRVEVVVEPALHGPNRKVSNLLNAYPFVRHAIVIVCDSDIRVPPGYLAAVCAPFADPGVGLVTSPYRSSRAEGVAAGVEALGFCTEMIPNVMAARRLEGLTFALGASMAVRRSVLEEIGGFAALVDYLADDYQLGNRVHRAGYRVELSRCFVESIVRGESLTSIFFRQLRWGRTMRVSRPGGWFASVVTHPFASLLAALAVSGFSSGGLAAGVSLYLVRSAVAIRFSRSIVGDRLLPRLLWLLPLRDALSFLVWLLSFTGNRVRWRGQSLRILPGGRITEL